MKGIYLCIVFLGVLILPSLSVRVNINNTYVAENQGISCSAPESTLVTTPTPPKIFKSCRQITGNSFTGSCDFAKAVYKNCGVKDSKGKRHKTLAGITELNNNYVIQDVIFSEFRKENGDYCRTDKVTIKWEPPIVSLLKWQPDSSSCNTCRCIQVANLFNKAAYDHEQYHLSDAIAITNQLNTSWMNREFTACSSNRLFVKSLLKIQIRNAKNQSITEADNSYKTSVENVHNLIGSQIPLDCTQCAPCQSGESPATCRVCEECKDGNCVPKICPDGDGCCNGKCCGISRTTGQTIACCNGVCEPKGRSACGK